MLRMVGVIGVSLSIVGRRFTSARATVSSYCAGSSGYEALSSDYKLDSVVVIHRHGDRAQIGRSIGPLWPEDEEITSFWRTKLPTEDSLKTLAGTFQSSLEEIVHDDVEGIEEHLYAGEDKSAYPYAMLSELGVNQLIAVGKHLRERYIDNGFISADHSKSHSEVYIRSTNMCRTLMSLRGLIAGLYEISGESHPSILKSKDFLSVSTRPKTLETLFPQGGGPCASMAKRRAEILTPESYVEGINNYEIIEEKVRDVLGLDAEESVNWIRVKEILTCHRVHGREYIAAISESEEHKVSEIAGWMWGKLYNDDKYNKLAIGRFLHELLLDIDQKVTQEGRKLLVYSGHDSTLVPVLCALKVYDNQWPPYASYLTLEMVTHKTSGARFVRALYNDESVAMLGQREMLLPYETFINRLQALSIDNENYLLQCEAGSEDAASFAKEIKKMTDEVRATTS